MQEKRNINKQEPRVVGKLDEVDDPIAKALNERMAAGGVT